MGKASDNLRGAADVICVIGRYIAVLLIIFGKLVSAKFIAEVEINI